jgi:recombinational DNA repair protein RecT
MAEEKKIENPIKALERQILGAKTVKDVLRLDFAMDRYVKNFQAMSGRTDGREQFEAEALNFIELANNKPDIMKCDRFSIIAGFMRAAVWNLSFLGNDLSVYPRGGKLVVEPQAHGKRRLMEKMPGVKEVKEGVLVFSKDEFEYDAINEKVVKHKQVWPRPEAKPENVVGVYCIIEYKDGNRVYIVLDQSEIAKARKSSLMTDGGKLWTEHYAEACKKTAYNRAFKVKWRKPEASVLYEQWEPKDDEPVIQEMAAEVVDEPTMPEPSIPGSEQVDKETGEVTIVSTEEEPKKEARPRRGKTSDGDLGL